MAFGCKSDQALENIIRDKWYAASYLDGNVFHHGIKSIDNIPPAVKSILVLRAVSYRIYATTGDEELAFINELNVKGRQYIGQAVEEVREEIATYQRTRLPEHRMRAVLSTFSLALADVRLLAAVRRRTR